MRHFAIGDVQGCYDALNRLLESIGYSESDALWFVGDLINRGPQSLETLRFIRRLPNTTVVLGNHDLHLLAIVKADLLPTQQDTFESILTAPDRDALCHWLSHQTLFHHDPDLNFSMVHAGLAPQWSIADALRLANEVETVLKSDASRVFYKHMYSNEGGRWSESLTGLERWRFIVNCLTRIRFCASDGTLDLKTKQGIGAQVPGFMPWFDVPERRSANDKLIFGHWAALAGRCYAPNTFAIDTGCVWGGALTALELETLARFSVSAR